MACPSRLQMLSRDIGYCHEPSHINRDRILLTLPIEVRIEEPRAGTDDKHVYAVHLSNEFLQEHPCLGWSRYVHDLDNRRSRQFGLKLRQQIQSPCGQSNDIIIGRKDLGQLSANPRRCSDNDGRFHDPIQGVRSPKIAPPNSKLNGGPLAGRPL